MEAERRPWLLCAMYVAVGEALVFLLPEIRAESSKQRATFTSPSLSSLFWGKWKLGPRGITSSPQPHPHPRLTLTFGVLIWDQNLSG